MFLPNIDYDEQMEAGVLGVCISEAHAFGSCRHLLTEECFYGDDHRAVYRVLLRLFDEGYPIDLLTVSRCFWDNGLLQVGHSGEVAYFLTRLMYGVSSAAHLEYWCVKLRELAARRMMISITSSGYKGGDVFDGAADIEARLKKVLEVRATDDWLHIAQVGVSQVQLMDARMGGRMPGISTSVTVLDELNGGFRAGNLVVIGARPSVGKSAFMGRIATCAAQAGRSVGIISLEMENTDIFARMVAAESQTDFYRIDRNELYEERQRSRVYGSIASLSTLPIYFSDSAQVTAQDIRAKADQLRRKHGLDLLIIDYLQLIEPDIEKGRNREQEVARISRSMKLLAKTLGIPVVLLAQLNRAVMERGDNKPHLHHLRESGSIEQDADVVMFLHRDWLTGKEQHEDGRTTEYEADLLVRKWRNGSPTEIKLGFDPRQMRFYEHGEGVR